jgi:hypothetical protein
VNQYLKVTSFTHICIHSHLYCIHIAKTRCVDAYYTGQAWQTIFWSTFGFTPPYIFPFCVVEAVGGVVRVAHFRGMYASTYSPLQLNLTCAVVLGLHLLLYSYLVATSFHYRMLTTAVIKLREYISRFTLQKNPSLHLCCILMPPLIKGIMETASRHDESLSFNSEGNKSESNARRIVTAANQVVGNVTIL